MERLSKDREVDTSDIEKPPFFKNWSGMYYFLIGFLIFQIIIYYIITIIY